ncbi:MAG: hypothetical protein KF894_07760 [Labilithrix sp.]|nr:hypothetical protein [Labilithrix sp.]
MQGQPFGYGYEPPGFSRGRPAVITWYRVYAASVLALYVGFFALWQTLVPAGPEEAAADFQPTLAGSVTVAALGLVGLGLGSLFAVGALVPYKPWGWTVGLIVICLGLSSCTAVAAIPLLIHWMKPQTKAAFGRL